MDTRITDYLQKCEQLAQANKCIPKLSLDLGNKYESAADVAKAISGLLEQNISAQAIQVQSTPCSTVNYCNSSYVPMASYFPEIAIIHFYYESNVGLFKAERLSDVLYFYSPLYLNNPDIEQSNRYFKRISIAGIILLALLMGMILLFA